jgi:hypothetical protein
MRRNRNAYWVLENLKEQDYFEELGINGGIILKTYLKEMG